MPQLDTNETEITYVIKSKDMFDEFQTRPIQNGILMMLGKLRGQTDDAFQPQSFIFRKPDWSEQQVLDWVNMHVDQFAKKNSADNLMKAFSEDKPVTKSIEDVEIFSVGTWNGDKYTTQDLDEMVRAFDDNKATMKPFLKLGHNSEQQLLQEDGLPAAGWISELKRVGEKLVAKFTDIPDKIFELIKRGAYKNVSSEIYWDINVNGTNYSKLLSGVALLGTNMPAVSNLKDILSLYGLKGLENLKVYADNSKETVLKSYNLDQKKEIQEMPTENEIALEAKVKKFETDAQVKADAFKALETEKSELETKNKEYSQKLEDEEKKRKEVELDTFIDAVEGVSPSMKPFMKELLSVDKKEYSIDKKQYSKNELLAEILKLHTNASEVNLDEGSKDGEKKGDQAAVEAKIEKYIAEHKCTYTQAYKAVLKGE